MASPMAKVNAKLAKRYGAGQVVLYRSPAGYYYFGGDHKHASDVESLYWFRVEASEIEEVYTEAVRQIELLTSGNGFAWNGAVREYSLAAQAAVQGCAK